jgi:hypothetical protein
VTETGSGRVGKLRSVGHTASEVIKGPMYVCPFDESIHVLTKMPLRRLEL